MHFMPDQLEYTSALPPLRQLSSPAGVLFWRPLGDMSGSWLPPDPCLYTVAAAGPAIVGLWPLAPEAGESLGLDPLSAM